MDEKDSMRSPLIPNTPAPAYSTLPDRGTEFHLAPLLNGRMGDVELETCDGKKFLVHKSILEAETVFFHIYFGFVPVWRLNGIPPVPYHVTQTQTQVQVQAPSSSLNPCGSLASAANAVNNLFCLPKILASHLRPSAAQSQAIALPMDDDDDDDAISHGAVPRPPPPPPKDHLTPAPALAPTPTTSPYTWSVPEPASVLTAFLSLIYPPGTIGTSNSSDVLHSLDLTGRVVRAALGYQSTKALRLARDRLIAFIPQSPVEVYAMATFFKFTDLAKLASGHTLALPRSSWGNENVVLMGRSGANALEALQFNRKTALRQILDRQSKALIGGGTADADALGHTEICEQWGKMQDLWERKVQDVKVALRADSDLLELLDVDLGGAHCGDCLGVLSKGIQRCLAEAKDVPRTV